MKENKKKFFFRIDDSQMVPNPIGSGMNCYLCKHSTNDRVCIAFKTIPDDIWFGRHDHTKPYPNDNGILFESLTLDK